MFLIQVLHEVIYHGEVHRLCSDDCFFTWRCNRNLAINFCEGCGMYCSSKGGGCQNLTIGDVNLRFCSPTCISTYKQVALRLQRSRRLLIGCRCLLSLILITPSPTSPVDLLQADEV